MFWIGQHLPTCAGHRMTHVEGILPTYWHHFMASDGLLHVMGMFTSPTCYHNVDGQSSP